MTLGLTDEQLDAFERVVRGKRVLDVGAGPYAPLTVEAAWRGAAEVVALDKEGFEISPRELPRCEPGGARLVEAALDRIPDLTEPGRFDVVLLSWPWLVASYEAVDRMLSAAPLLLYLGKNTEGIRCGAVLDWLHKALWERLTRMPVLEHVEASVQVLTLYDARAEAALERPLLDEERGALSKSIEPYRSCL